MAANLGNVIAQGAKKTLDAAGAVNKAAPGTLQAVFGSLLSLFPGHTILGSVGRSMTGSGLSGAEIQANQFNADQAQLAYERELSADSTKYQRSVADMKAAGLNPMLAAGSTGGSVNSSAASSVSPGAPNLSALFDMAMASEQLKIQRDLANAEIKNKDADTKKKASETVGQDIQNEVAEASKVARSESYELENRLTRKKISEIDEHMKEISANVDKLVQETKTEEERRSLVIAQRVLTYANARQVAQLLPYQKLYMKAQTENERQAAKLAAAHTMYQEHLISDGYLNAFISEAKSKAVSAEAKAELDAIAAGIRTGDYEGVKGLERYGQDTFGRDIMQGISIVFDNINPLNRILN